MKEETEKQWVNDDNRVFKDEDIKKCQEAMTKKFDLEYEIRMDAVMHNIMKTQKPWLMPIGGIQLSGVLPMGNPCAEIQLPGIGSMNDMAARELEAARQFGLLEKEKLIGGSQLSEPLDPAELVKANMIEDYLESYLTKHYSSDILEYDVDLPEKVSDRILAFIRERMYNWTIYTINEQKWRLTWG